MIILNAHDDFRWRTGTPLILVECKNWSSNCGKNELVQFRAKIENRRDQCRLGFLISWTGFADTVTKELLRGSRDEIVIGLISGENLKATATTGSILPAFQTAWEAAVLD